MVKFYIPSKGPESWKALLADPEKQWQKGYSARSLAYCWEEAKGFPQSVSAVFIQSGIPLFREAEFLFGIPEHKVKLPGRGRESQNDIFVLARSARELIAITVEGKVSEQFDNNTVEEWLVDASTNRKYRIQKMAEMLHLDLADIRPIKYQLIHRTVSALLEADRFCANHALMLVHSFSQSHEWFDHYAEFASLFDVEVSPGLVVHAGDISGKELYLGWVTGEKEYLQR
ncbi:MAG: hypothetical protein P8126_10995 [Gammaproteobacteria bacterium]